MMMKTKLFYLLLVFSLFLNMRVQAQMVVSDPTMLGESIKNWGEQLKQAEQNFKQFQEQTKIMKDAAEALKKVNTSIMASRRMKTLLEQQKSIAEFLYSEINSAQNRSVNYEATTAYVKRLNSLQERLITNTSYITDLLADGVFNLSDGERLRELNQVTNENGALLNSAAKEKTQFDDLNAKLKEINRLMNN